MKKSQVAAQLYTCRDLLKTPAEIAKTLKEIRKIGYLAVQISGMGPIPEDELNKILDGEGLVCCATHENGEQILKFPEKVVERLAKLRCKYTAYPYPAGIDFSSEESVNNLIKGLECSGKVLSEAGQVLTYHNHHIEFRKLNGRLILDQIYDKTNAKYLQGEIDTYWVQYGGCDAAAWCKKLKNRLPLLHMKDFRINEKNEIQFCEIGSGNLDFKGIIAEAEASGCQWFIVEQDVCPGNPLDSLAKSFNYITENLVK